MHKLFAIVAMALTPMLLAGCNDADPCLAATDVRQCQATQAASRQGDGNGLLYAAAGYALGTSMSGGSRTVHNTTIVNRTIYRPTYRPSYRSSFGGYRSSAFGSRSFGRR